MCAGVHRMLHVEACKQTSAIICDEKISSMIHQHPIKAARSQCGRYYVRYRKRGANIGTDCFAATLTIRLRHIAMDDIGHVSVLF